MPAGVVSTYVSALSKSCVTSDISPAFVSDEEDDDMTDS